MKIGILGTGAYGLSLALMFNENDCDTLMWSKFDEEIKELETKGKSPKLPGVKIPEEINYTTNLETVVGFSDLIVIAVPAAFVSSTAQELQKYYKNDIPLCIATKGIEQDSCLFVTDIVKKYIKTNKLAVISGPSFAIDIASYVPIGLSVATHDKKTLELLEKSLANKYLKLRHTKDILGIEICGAVKNVIAIACGMIDGMDLPESTKAMFITEALNDIKALIKALGGKGETILTFAGFGDLLLTCTSTKSRNFTYGKLIGSNVGEKKIKEYENSTTIEGLYTLKSIHKLIQKRNVKIPIINLIYDIVFNGEDPESLLVFLIEKE